MRAADDIFTIAQARERGLNRGRLQGPGFQPLFKGVYATVGPVGRIAFAQVRVGAQSVRETQLRLLQVLAGLPCPSLQAEICHPGTGRRMATVDQLHREQRVVLEYEGDHHRTDRSQWNTDTDRYDGLARLGYRVLRVTISRLRQPDRLVEEVRGPARERMAWRSAPVHTPMAAQLRGLPRVPGLEAEQRATPENRTGPDRSRGPSG